ncbi:MAG: hypothetical protein AB1546_09635 [bacterium]
MGKIIVQVEITNALAPANKIKCNSLVDTGTSGLILPKAWKDKLGDLPACRLVEMETADQRVVSGEVCGPVKIQIDGFEPIFNEVIFLDINGSEKSYEPLLGYIILEQSRAAVDLEKHRLVEVKYFDLKNLKKFGD